MATAKITLRKDQVSKAGECRVVVQLNEGKQVKRIPLGFSVKPSEWDETVCRVTNTRKGYKKLNSCIQAAEKKLQLVQAVLTLSNDNSITGFELTWGLDEEDLLISQTDLLIGRQAVTEEIKLAPVVRIPNQQERNKAAEKEWSDAWEKYSAFKKGECEFNTWRRLDNVNTVVRDYCKKRGFALCFDLMDEDFIYGFKSYLLNEHKNRMKSNKKGVGNSCVHDYRKALTAFLNWCTRRKFNTRLDYQLWNVATSKPKTDLQWLTEAQLVELANYPLRPGSSYDVTRDLFIFSAFTGLRDTDIRQWIPTNVQGGVIQLRAEKSRKDCSIPLNQYSQAILAKYNYRLPKQANTKINANIKQILALMGYDQIMINRVQSVGVKDIVNVMPLSQAISIHSARRSFINLMIYKGVNITFLSQMTGNSIRSLEIYFKKSTKDLVNVMQGLQFQQASPLRVAV